MEQDISQVVGAIVAASDPSQSHLHQEALSFLSTVQKNSQTTWRLALSLFLDRNSDGTYKFMNDARFFALRVLDDFLENRFEPFDEDTFKYFQQALVNYIQSEYVFGNAEPSAPYIRNKFSHTLTLFFLCVYMDQWPTFFSDLLSSIQPQDPSQPYNPHLCILFFRIVLEISGEVADQILKSARTYHPERLQRDSKVRDLVRERDAGRLNDAVLFIINQGKERLLDHRRNANITPDLQREINQTAEIVEIGVKTYASYVGWIDINLTVTPSSIPLLFTLLADPALPIRLVTCTALTRIVCKGLKAPLDKLQLLKVLSLNEVLDALEIKTREEQKARGDDDEAEEHYREALGKLLNVLGLELNKLIDDSQSSDQTKAEALMYHAGLLPILLRFMSDDWDDTCSTVFPFLHTVLAGYKPSRKGSAPPPLDENRRNFLNSLMQVILIKAKWASDAETGDPEDESYQEFESLRKNFRIFLEAVMTIDIEMVTNTIRTSCLNTLSSYQSGIQVAWNDAELALYLVYVYGESNKQGIKGRGAFCHAPPVEKDKRKHTDYSSFPLTPLGDMILAVVQSGIVSYQHSAVSLMFFEIASRYTDFFKIRKECIMPTLEAFLDTRGLHHQGDSHYRSRLYYLFFRFIKEARNDIPPDISPTLVDSLRDLLPIQISPIEAKDGDSNSTIDDPLTTLTVNDTTFESQLYLYESVGIAISIIFRTPDQQASLLTSVYKPLLDDLELSLATYSKTPQDILVIAKIHHIILALGNITKGFPDFPTPVPDDYILPPIPVFTHLAQAILVCLERMNTQKVIRDATRFAFARILAPTGPNVTHFVPALMSNLLSHFEPSELVDFINFLSLLIHKLQAELFNVLDELIDPLGTHILQLLAQPVSGTDEQRSHTETKRTYLNFMNNVMISKLHGVFISDRNKGSFESLLATMQRIAEDMSDFQASRTAFLFLERSVTVWGSKSTNSIPSNGLAQQEFPGFERFIYERLVPAAFQVCSLPELQGKDGGILTVLHQLANVFGAVMRARGSEAYDFFLQVYLPSQNWPPELATEFSNNLRDMDAKGFRKYFAEFVRSSRSSS